MEFDVPQGVIDRLTFAVVGCAIIVTPYIISRAIKRTIRRNKIKRKLAQDIRITQLKDNLGTFWYPIWSGIEKISITTVRWHTLNRFVDEIHKSKAKPPLSSQGLSRFCELFDDEYETYRTKDCAKILVPFLEAEVNLPETDKKSLQVVQSHKRCQTCDITLTDQNSHKDNWFCTKCLERYSNNCQQIIRRDCDERKSRQDAQNRMSRLEAEERKKLAEIKKRRCQTCDKILIGSLSNICCECAKKAEITHSVESCNNWGSKDSRLAGLFVAHAKNKNTNDAVLVCPEQFVGIADPEIVADIKETFEDTFKLLIKLRSNSDSIADDGVVNDCNPFELNDDQQSVRYNCNRLHSIIVNGKTELPSRKLAKPNSRWWVTQNGSPIQITEMTTQHLTRVEGMLKHNGRRFTHGTLHPSYQAVKEELSKRNKKITLNEFSSRYTKYPNASTPPPDSQGECVDPCGSTERRYSLPDGPIRNSDIQIEKGKCIVKDCTINGEQFPECKHWGLDYQNHDTKARCHRTSACKCAAGFPMNQEDQV